jgi:hypothetical protein
MLGSGTSTTDRVVSFTTAHLSQFTALWNFVRDMESRQDQEDQITWARTPWDGPPK